MLLAILMIYVLLMLEFNRFSLLGFYYTQFDYVVYFRFGILSLFGVFFYLHLFLELSLTFISWSLLTFPFIVFHITLEIVNISSRLFLVSFDISSPFTRIPFHFPPFPSSYLCFLAYFLLLLGFSFFFWFNFFHPHVFLWMFRLNLLLFCLMAKVLSWIDFSFCMRIIDKLIRKLVRMLLIRVREDTFIHSSFIALSHIYTFYVFFPCIPFIYILTLVIILTKMLQTFSDHWFVFVSKFTRKRIWGNSIGMENRSMVEMYRLKRMPKHYSPKIKMPLHCLWAEAYIR